MQPNDSVHHETIRLVSLSFRFRNRIAFVVSTSERSTGIRCSRGAPSPRAIGTRRQSAAATGLVPLLGLGPERLQRRVEIAAHEDFEMLIATRIRMIGAAHCFHRREMLAV